MMNLLTVQDPDENAAEQATDTRLKLQDWADRVLPAVQDEGIKALSDTRIKDLRVFGVQAMDKSAADLVEAAERGWSPANQFMRLMVQFNAATRHIVQVYDKEVEPRDLSHALEGAVREFNKLFFQAGMKWNLQAEYLALVSQHCPHRTSGYVDELYRKQAGVGGGHLRDWHTPYTLGERGGVWAPRTATVQDTVRSKFEEIKDWVLSVSGTSPQDIARNRSGYWDVLTNWGCAGFCVHYMDIDGPWVAGLLSVEDACRMRFRRVRLGSYLAEHGLSDAAVRSYVEQAKQQVASANFYAYPNDVEWEELYTCGPHSCMADSAGEYETWDGIHPVSAYSSAYHGAGDNSLVLLVSRDEQDSITGRGILNLQTGSIVRWYGDNVAERALLRAGVKVDDRRCLKGSWLAHISKGAKFIHPYVDGDYGYGDIRDGRVYIGEDGIELQETSGSSYAGDVEYCIDVQENLPADECIWQRHSRNWISRNCDSWRCPVIDEYAREYDRSSMNIHGVDVQVSDTVRYDAHRYLSRDESRGTWTIDDDTMRMEFLEYHGLEEDEPDEEEAA